MNRFEKHEARDKTFRRLEREYERLSRARTGGALVLHENDSYIE